MKRPVLLSIVPVVVLVACSSGSPGTVGSAAQALSAPGAGFGTVDADAAVEVESCSEGPTDEELAQMLAGEAEGGDAAPGADAAPPEVGVFDAGVGAPTDSAPSMDPAGGGAGCAPGGPGPGCRCPEVTVRCGDNASIYICHPTECVMTIPQLACAILGIDDGERKRQADLAGLPFKDLPAASADELIPVCIVRHEAVHACQKSPKTIAERNCLEPDAYKKGSECLEEAKFRYCAVNPREEICAKIDDELRTQLAGHTYTSCRCRGGSRDSCIIQCYHEIRCSSKSRQEATSKCGVMAVLYK